MLHISNNEIKNRVFTCSPWVAEKCEQNPDLLTSAFTNHTFTQIYNLHAYQQQLAQLHPLDFAQLCKQLRQFRQQAMIRIIWRMSAGWAPLEETIADLSALADAVIQFVEQQLFTWLSAKYGTPEDEQQAPQHLLVIALGKLGGQELNLSSDIDLLFAYPQEGKLTNSALTYGEFYLRLAQQFIKALNDITLDGYVFRVDMRLRPYGDGGPLVMSFESLENYYQAQGRGWERYALIKARPITGNANVQQEFINLIRPFVYRRYVDYSVLESLREMQDLIQQEVQRKGLQHHIKLGAGGIRSIEFIVQMHQLIRGGREPRLQQAHFFTALNELAQLGFLQEDVAIHLRDAYIFLRQVEHALQAVHDQQTHVLPQQPAEQQRLAYALNVENWHILEQKIKQIRQQVADYFAIYSMLPEMQKKESAISAQSSNATIAVSSIWLGQIEETEACALLQALGFTNSLPIYKLLRHYADLPSCRHLSPQATQRLLAFIPALLNQVIGENDPEASLLRTLDVVMAVVKRSAYLVLLLENPAALHRLVKLCTASSWLTQELICHPALLDELLSDALIRVPTRHSILQELQHALAKVPIADVEQQLDIVRYVKRVNFLRVAIGELNGLLNVMQVSRALTIVAEVILRMVLVLVWRQQLKSQLDQPALLEQTLRQDWQTTKKLPFAIIAYGKLASRELSYTSDLDVVFLYESCDLAPWGLPLHNANEVFLRVAQRMMHWLNTPTHMGVLFRVDTQLQPEGSAGLLVSDWQRFVDYQQLHTWLWEQQALVRSRLILGALDWHRRFRQLRKHILTQPRSQKPLQQEIIAMRTRMQKTASSQTGGVVVSVNKVLFDLKKASGGMIDIEFIVQYAVLYWAAEYPMLLRYLDISHLCQALALNHCFHQEQAGILTEAYNLYQERAHRLALQNLPPLVNEEEYALLRAKVKKIWKEILKGE